jgi:GrpB-like predicted nucleotidyltransferase (UPF0157 family)
VTPREDDAIRVVAYDTDWQLRFQTLAAKMRSLLGARVARVEHVGSTAVPGLAAKPILDIDVVVRAAADLEPSIRELEKAGYRYEGDLGVAGREALRRPPDSEPHHLYLLVEGSPELQRHLAFRDALRADQVLREEYAALKRALAQRFHDDRRAYTIGKSDFIATALKRVLPMG